MPRHAHSIVLRAVVRAVALLVLARVMGAADARAAGQAPRPREVAEVRIELSRASAGPGDEVTVTLLLLDGREAPVDASGVTLECLNGSLTPLARDREGVHRATLTVPRQLPHVRSSVLFAMADGRSSERTLALVPGPASAVEISGPATLPTHEPGHLTVSLLDAFGNASDDEPLARSGAGPLPVRPVGAGLWTVEYAPTSAEERLQDEIVVEAGAARGSWTIQLARTERWLAVAPWAGAALGRSSGAAAGASASAWWLAGPDELGLVLDAGWWRLGERSAVALPGGSAEVVVERTYVPMTAAFAWTHQLRHRLSTTASLGGGAALVSASERLSGQPTVEESRWAPAMVAAAALGYRVGRGVVFFEARGVWVGDAGLSAVTGTSSALLLIGGYRYDAR